MEGVAVLTSKKLKEFVKFIPGINQSRLEASYVIPAIKYYDQSAFESDFYFQNDLEKEKDFKEVPGLPCLCLDDVVISCTKQAAAIVGKKNENKILPINFIHVEFWNQCLDKRYFLFLFNSFKDVQRQKERETQGIGLVQKIPLRSLGEIQVPYIAMPQQKLIGDAYVEMLRLQNKLKKYSELGEALTCQILENVLEEARRNEK